MISDNSISAVIIMKLIAEGKDREGKWRDTDSPKRKPLSEGIMMKTANAFLAISITGLTSCTMLLNPDLTGRDAGRDASVDARADSDANTEADMDMPDADLDAGHDIGVDAAPDSSHDADVDMDSGSDSGSDAMLDSGTDAGLDSGMDSGIDSGLDSGIDSGSDAGPLCTGVSNTSIIDGEFFMSTPLNVGGYDITYTTYTASGVLLDIGCGAGGASVASGFALNYGAPDTILNVPADGKKLRMTLSSRTATRATISVHVETL